MIDYKTKNLLKALLKQKYISKEEYHKAYKTLEKCKEKDKEFYYTNKAKFLITQKRYEEAKRILLQIEQEENKPSFYYSLYKISIYEKNITKAYMYLLDYCKVMIKKLKIPNVLLPIVLMEQYKSLCKNPISFFTENEEISNHNEFNIYEIKDKQLLSIYYQIIININQKDYQETKYQIEEATEIIEKYQLPIDFDEIYSIIEQIEIKLKEEIPNLLKDDLESNIHKFILEVAYKNHLIDYESLLREINKLIKKDYKLGKNILEQVKYDLQEKNYRVELNYLQRKINEKQLYEELTEEQQKIYHTVIRNGNGYYKERKTKSFYKEYLIGKEKTNHPIFDYYIGKSLYKMHDYENSEKYLLEYLKTGGEKLPKALLYLECIKCKNLKNEEKHNTGIHYIEKLNSFDGESISINKTRIKSNKRKTKKR